MFEIYPKSNNIPWKNGINWGVGMNQPEFEITKLTRLVLALF